MNNTVEKDTLRIKTIYNSFHYLTVGDLQEYLQLLPDNYPSSDMKTGILHALIKKALINYSLHNVISFLIPKYNSLSPSALDFICDYFSALNSKDSVIDLVISQSQLIRSLKKFSFASDDTTEIESERLVKDFLFSINSLIRGETLDPHIATNLSYLFLARIYDKYNITDDVEFQTSVVMHILEEY